MNSFLGKTLGILAFLTLLNFWPVLIGRIPFPARIVTQFPPWESVRGPESHPFRYAELGDLATQFYPWKSFLHDSIRRGTLPLWNSHQLLGAPFQSEPQTGLFYPLNVLYYVLPTSMAWSLGFLLRTILIGLFTALFLRSLGSGTLGAATAAIVFAFCGFITAFQGRPHVDTSLWLPLVCLGIDRLQRKLDARSVVLAGVALALPVLAGHVENAAHVAIVAALFFLYRWLWASPGEGTGPSQRPRFLALFAAAGFLALALASVQMLPTLEWIGLLGRTIHKAWTARPSAEILTLVSRDLRANPNSAGIAIPEGAGYAGMLTLLLAPLALLNRNRRDAIFFGVLVAASLQVVYGWGPLYWLSRHVPVVQAIPNGRLLVVADFGLAVLAGLGVSALAQMVGSDPRRRPNASWWLLPACASLLCAAGVGFLQSRSGMPVPSAGGPAGDYSWLQGPRASAGFLLASGALIAWAVSGHLRPRRFALLVVGLLSADLVTATYGYIPFVEAREIFPPAPLFDFLRRQGPERGRVASVDITYGANFEMMYGLESPGGYDILLRRTARILSTVCPPGDAAYLNSGMVVKPGRILDLMNIRYLVATTWNASAGALAARPDRFSRVFTEGSVRVFENRSALPRAFLVPASRAEVLADDEEQFARVSDPAFDPERSVVLSERPALGADHDGLAGKRPTAGISASDRRINEIDLVADVAEPSLIVVSEAHYPAWNALVDGKKAPVLRADYAFLAAALSPGHHTVRFTCAPKTFRVGAFLSGSALLICLALCTTGRNRRKADRTDP